MAATWVRGKECEAVATTASALQIRNQQSGRRSRATHCPPALGSFLLKFIPEKMNFIRKIERFIYVSRGSYIFETWGTSKK
jgi:hypothetical protein